MDYVAQKNTAVATTTPCIWTADDCYPASLLCWLQQQVEPSMLILESTDLALEGV